MLKFNYPYKDSNVVVEYPNENGKFVAVIDNILAFPGDDLEAAKNKAFAYLDKRESWRRVKATQVSNPSTPK